MCIGEVASLPFVPGASEMHGCWLAPCRRAACTQPACMRMSSLRQATASITTLLQASRLWNSLSDNHILQLLVLGQVCIKQCVQYDQLGACG